MKAREAVLGGGVVLIATALSGAALGRSAPAAVALAAVAVAAGAIAGWGLRRFDAGTAAEVDAARGGETSARSDAAALREDVSSRDAVLSNMSEGVVLFAPGGLVAYANPAARTLLGRRFDTVTEVTPAVLREAVVEAARGVGEASDANASGGAVQRQFENAHAVIQATVIPTDPPGTVVLVARDVTEARRVERLRRDFVTNASHELKTPVASILALAQTLKQAAPDDPSAVARFLERLEQEAFRLSRLVGDLLELSRLEGDGREPEELRLDEIVAAEAERLRARAEAVGLRFLVEPLARPVVLGSRADLALLVHNLLDNAIRYTPDGGEVRVSLSTANGLAVVQVDDTGIGIPSRDLGRIFERFYRVDPARSRETGGTGLGLAIVRNVVESHGGDVRARSVLGAGSTFIARIPTVAGAP